MWFLLKKEIRSFLSSLIGYVVVAVFLLINGLFLWVFPLDFNILNFGYAGLDSLFMLSPIVFLFLIPAITMRSFSDEKKGGTIELLLTKPLSDFQIVFAKFLAGLLLMFISLLPTLIYYFTVYKLGFPAGNIDTGGTWGSYLGLFFLGAAFVSIGLFCSSLTDNQVVAFVVAVFVSGFMYLGFELIYSLSLFGKADLFIRSLGISAHYTSISRGVIDTRDLLYYFGITSIFLLLTRISLQSRKW